LKNVTLKSPSSTLWEFLSRESAVPLPRVLGIAAVSGLSNAFLLWIVNSAANSSTDAGPDWQAFFLFLIAISLYVLTQRYVLHVSAVEIEKIVAKVRVKLADKIRTADLQAVEGIGRSQIFASLNTHTMTLSQATAPMVLACQGMLLVFFSALYIFLLSKMAFFLTLAIVVAGILFHLRHKKQVIQELERSTVKENELFAAFTHLLEGFKEVKLSARRSAELHADLKNIAFEVAALKTRSGARYADLHIFTQVLFYLLLAAIVFVLPGLSHVYVPQVTQISAAILFIIGPLSLIVGVFPMFRRANHAIENILGLEALLERAQPREPEQPVTGPPSFTRIQLSGVMFTYTDREGQAGFTMGPVDLTLARGERLFIVGGNGSGKSTLLKVLTGLYRPTAGTILVDDVPVAELGYAAYRELFSAVFSDYHLFDRLYGIAEVNDEEVKDKLAEMDLRRKTAWRGGRFVNQDLSTGQRKRLALLISRLEKKPIQVLDEWAADQDPQFRFHFYTELLNQMRDAGQTVVAATHDDKYYPYADRVMTMQEGKVVSIKRKEGTSP
jgi:putative pyoverdin transport system ATP-binding/permease protein